MSYIPDISNLLMAQQPTAPQGAGVWNTPSAPQPPDQSLIPPEPDHKPTLGEALMHRFGWSMPSASEPPQVGGEDVANPAPESVMGLAHQLFPGAGPAAYNPAMLNYLMLQQQLEERYRNDAARGVLPTKELPVGTRSPSGL